MEDITERTLKSVIICFVNRRFSAPFFKWGGVKMKIIQFEQKWEESIVQLWNQCCTKDLITIEQFRKKILFDENFDSELCWIAIEENSAIGFLLAIKRKFPYLERGLEKERGWISVMFVSPDYRHQGIGSALLEIAEEKLASLGVNEITLAAYSPNYFFSGIDEENYSEAAQFFQNRGYVGKDKHYSMGRNLEDFEVKGQVCVNGYQIIPFEYSYALELLDFLKKEFGGGWKRNALLSMQQKTAEENILLLLDADKSIKGFCMKAIDGNQERFGPIGIAAEKRNKGLGTMLLNEALKWMKRHGIKQMFFMSTDEAGKRYYLRNGLMVLRTYSDYRKRIVTK